MQVTNLELLKEAAKQGFSTLESLVIKTLSGDANKATRQAIYSEMVGEKTPVAKCGITAITKKAWELYGVQPEAEKMEVANEPQAEISKAVEKEEGEAAEEAEAVESHKIQTNKDGIKYLRRKDLEEKFKASKVAKYSDVMAKLLELGFGETFCLLHRQREIASAQLSFNLVWEYKGVKHTPSVENFGKSFYCVDAEGVKVEHINALLLNCKTPEELIQVLGDVKKNAFVIKNDEGVLCAGDVYWGINTIHQDGEGKEFELGCRTYNLLRYYRFVELVVETTEE